MFVFTKFVFQITQGFTKTLYKIYRMTTFVRALISCIIMEVIAPGAENLHSRVTFIVVTPIICAFLRITIHFVFVCNYFYKLKMLQSLINLFICCNNVENLPTYLNMSRIQIKNKYNVKVYNQRAFQYFSSSFPQLKLLTNKHTHPVSILEFQKTFVFLHF